MIRWAKPEDGAAVVSVLRAAQAGWSGFDYANLSGPCLVYEHEGQIVGFVLGQITRPDAYIREIAVLPTHHRLGVARSLLMAFALEAKAAGAESVEAFQYEGVGEFVKMVARFGIMVEPGVRIRIPLTLRAMNVCQVVTAGQDKLSYARDTAEKTSWKEETAAAKNGGGADNGG